MAGHYIYFTLYNYYFNFSLCTLCYHRDKLFQITLVVLHWKCTFIACDKLNHAIILVIAEYGHSNNVDDWYIKYDETLTCSVVSEQVFPWKIMLYAYFGSYFLIPGV